MPMGEMIVSAVVSVLIEKLFSGALKKLAPSPAIDFQLKELKKTLSMIRGVLADAGKKQITDRTVEFWLKELQELAYDIDDALDELANKDFERKFKQSDVGTSRSNKLQKVISASFPYSGNSVTYVPDMSSKLGELTTKAHELVDRIKTMGLNASNEEPDRRYKPLEETSLVEVSNVLGRDEDEKALLEMLTGVEAGNQNVSILSIVGLGGIGKTTLAKVLYNNEKVKEKFEFKVWVCVSNEFDVFGISKQIYQAVTDEDKSFANLDMLHVALKKKLSTKRFLIVLDDVWNEDPKMWEVLERPLVGVPGSKILVTTRKSTVASAMNSVQTHRLGVLSNKYAMSLFAKSALDEQNYDKYPSLIPIAQQIVNKCNGLPLALIALGRVLKTKGNHEDEWVELLNSEIWSSNDHESAILPALKLSYYDLPSHLKQLFAYCSLFPKDYIFVKKKLVLLWMAEGFLSQTKGKQSMESLGYQYLDELQLRSFFQRSTYGAYTMHDLMHDLAISVAGEFFFILDDQMNVNDRNEAFEKFRHFSLIGQHQHDVVCSKIKELHRATRLRTFLLALPFSNAYNILDNILVDLLPRIQFLRVLSLTNYPITEVPQFIGKMKHLRYINFSRTRIEQLPEKVSELYNLQSLLICDCLDLTSLPVSFVKLINLRHLDMSNTPSLKKTPIGIGELTSLQTLSKVYIEQNNGFNLSELKDLVDLQGGLSINGLDKVIDPMQAKDANLQQKYLDKLEMSWSDIFDYSRNSAIEYEVLKRLRPDNKLKELTISFYGGEKFPSWVGDPLFDQLTELRLEGCRSCTNLPTLGHLKSLRKLFVKNLDRVETWSFKGISFSSLEILEVYHMEGLKIWSNNVGEANDINARLFPRLLELIVEGCSEEVLGTLIIMSTSVIRLSMKDIKGLTKFHGEVLKHLRVLRYLNVEDCNELRYLWDSELEAYRSLESLYRLSVRNCKELVRIGEKEEDHVNVGSSSSISSSNSRMGSNVKLVILGSCEKLECYNCPNSIVSLEMVLFPSLTSLTLASSLKSLSIASCMNLKSFPHEQLQSLRSLELLHLYNSPNIDHSFPCGLWPPNLRTLRIGMLNKPMSKWGLQNYPTSLVDLVLYGDDSRVTSFAMEEDAGNTSSISFLLPPSLSSLTIVRFNDVESLSDVLQHLTHLKHLDIQECPNLIDVPETTSSLEIDVNDRPATYVTDDMGRLIKVAKKGHYGCH